MNPTPAHERHNPELLREMPAQARCVIEVGCSVGALAREYKKLNPACRYIGIEAEPAFAALARRHCDAVYVWDIEGVVAARSRDALAGDCWVFGDVLEHLRDPWSLLAAVRAALPTDGCIVACIPNAQHWSVQLRLNSGELRYEDAGLLDRTHLRWFTRKTIVELFEGSGFRIEHGCTRVMNHPARERVLAGVRALAAATGADPEQAVVDALATQYVVRAVPA
jgi:SAM-dependent methyltransferase